TGVPLEKTAFGRTTYGKNNDIVGHAYVGNTIDTAAGAVGYVLEGYFRGYDGFRSIDESPDYKRDGNDTGLTRYEPMIKLQWEPKSSMYQRVEAKFGYTD